MDGIDLVGDGSVRAVWKPTPAEGFRRPSPATVVTIEISRMPPLNGEGGAAVEDHAAAACDTETADSPGHKPTITAAVGEEAFVQEVETTLGFDAYHPIEMAVLRMRRGESVIVTVASGPGSPCAFMIKLVKVVLPVPFEELGAEAHVRLAKVARDTAERYRAIGALAWAADRFARGVKSMLMCSLLLGGSAVTDGHDLANVLRQCYVGLARCHCERASIDPPPACRDSSLHKSILAASRALEMDSTDAEALAVTERAKTLLKTTQI